VKGSVIVVGALIVARCARTAAGASLLLGLGPWALGLVILLGPLFPELNSGVVAIGHDVIQPVSIGPLTASPALVLVAIWGVGVLVMVGRLVCDVIAARVLVRKADGRWR
jgi:beta-lactamase regulating signal transducer with metallopeptidase domain